MAVPQVETKKLPGIGTTPPICYTLATEPPVLTYAAWHSPEVSCYAFATKKVGTDLSYNPTRYKLGRDIGGRGTFGGRHKGGESFTSLVFERLPEAVAARPHTLIGRDVVFVSGSGANQMGQISLIDPSTRTARFSRPLRHVIDGSSAYVCLGVVQIAVVAHGEKRGPWDEKHWALKRTLKHYYEAALGTLLGQSLTSSAMSGTDLAYAAVGQRASFGVNGTDIASVGTLLGHYPAPKSVLLVVLPAVQCLF
eukprot:3941451-Rhodomonas_salina.2